MDDAGRVRRDESRNNRADDMKRFGDRQPALLAQHSRKVCTLDVRHRDVLDAVDLAEIMNADDVLVGHLTRQHQFALESAFDFGTRGGIRGDLPANHFDRDRHPQFAVPGLVDRTHATDAEHADHVVSVAEALPDCQRAAVHRTRSSGARNRQAGRSGQRGRVRLLVIRCRTVCRLRWRVDRGARSFCSCGRSDGQRLVVDFLRFVMWCCRGRRRCEHANGDAGTARRTVTCRCQHRLSAARADHGSKRGAPRQE